MAGFAEIYEQMMQWIGDEAAEYVQRCHDCRRCKELYRELCYVHNSELRERLPKKLKAIMEANCLLEAVEQAG